MKESERSGQALSLQSAKEGEEWVLALAGELDLAESDRFRSELERAQASEVARVIVDLGQLEFIDSTGLRVLLQAEAASRNGSSRVVFRRGSAQVQRVMRISGIDRELTFVD